MIFLTVALFFVVAMLYQTAGFGGASSYIAILVLMAFPNQDIRFIGLVCNIAVVIGDVVDFSFKGMKSWMDAALILVASIPLAYYGGSVTLSNQEFKIGLGVLLFLSALLMLIDYQRGSSKTLPNYYLPVFGGILGFISGLLGLSCGIFLAPILYLSKWKASGEVIAMGSFFIFVNSIAGLAGSASIGMTNSKWTLAFLVLAVLIGKFIGSKMELTYWKPQYIRFASAMFIGFVSLKLLFNQFSYLVH